MSCLAIVLDTNARHWGAVAEEEGHTRTLVYVGAAIVGLTNAHLSRDAANRAVVIAAARPTSTPVLWSSVRAKEVDSTETLKRSMAEAILGNAENEDTATPLTAALAVALCQVRAAHRSLPVAEQQSAKGGQVVVITAGVDAGAEHALLLNLLLGAAQNEIRIGGVALGKNESTFVQQAAHVTGSLYHSVRDPQRLLAVLLGADAASYHVEKLDVRAACACHAQLVSQGWLCPVCLAVFCQRKVFCPRCNAFFKVSGALMNRKRRPTPTPGVAPGGGGETPPQQPQTQSQPTTAKKPAA